MVIFKQFVDLLQQKSGIQHARINANRKVFSIPPKIMTQPPRKRSALAVALVSIFCCSSLSPAIAASRSPKPQASEVKEVAFLDGLINVVKGQKVCLTPGLCLNTNALTEVVLAKQIRELAEKNAPVTVSSNNLFPTTPSLPGKPFTPAILDLRGASPNDVIPPGDYVIPVQVFCLQKPAGSPNGHRYLLGQYGGKRQKVLESLNKAAASSGVAHRDLQNLSWAIQSGVAYQDMPQEMRGLADQLIPEHKSALGRGWLEEIEAVWNTGSRILNLPSFESFLANQLGDVGNGVIAFREVKNRLVNRGHDWRNLSDIFVIDNGTEGTGDIFKTPWSNLKNGMNAKFLTNGNYDDIGFLLVRVPNQTAASRQVVLVASVNLANLTQGSGKLRVHELDSLISSLAAIPEGNAPIQPLGMSNAAGGFLGKTPVRNGEIQVAVGPGVAIAPWLINAIGGSAGAILAAKAVQDTQEILNNEREQEKKETPSKPDPQPKDPCKENPTLKECQERKFNTPKAASKAWKNFKNYKGDTKTNGKPGKEREYYQWDHTHNDIEVYDSRGNHKGSMEPDSGKLYKGSVSGRKINL